jgi:hypothetical protein
MVDVVWIDYWDVSRPIGDRVSGLFVLYGR